MTNKDNIAIYSTIKDVEAGDPPVTVSGSILLSGPKEGHSFCGCCCDMRRATIIINIYLLVSSIFSVFYLYFFLNNLPSITANIQDDTVKQQMETIDFSSIYTPLVIAMMVVSSLGSIVAIVGALKYNTWLVGVNVVIFVVGTITGIVTSYQTGTSPGVIILIQLVRCFFIYPQVMFVYEIEGTKTMSQQTYPREEQSCCCVATKYRDNVY